MRIVLDANPLHGDLTLRQPHARLLLLATQSDDPDLVVPEIVVLEMSKLFREQVEDGLSAFGKGRRIFRTLGLEADVPEIELDATAERYVRELRERLQEAGASTPAPPEADHLELAKRAIEIRPPFDAKGRGYRDSLLWLQAVEEAQKDDVLLVTNDEVFYASKDDSELAPALQEELSELGLDHSIRLARSLRDAVKDHVESSLGALTRIRRLFEEERIRHQLLDELSELIAYRDFDAPDDEDLRRLDVTQIQVQGLHELKSVEVDEAYEAEGGAVTFNFGVVVDAEVEFFPFKSEAYGSDLGDVAVLDWDWNESVVLASKMLELSIEGTAEYDVEARAFKTMGIFFVY